MLESRTWLLSLTMCAELRGSHVDWWGCCGLGMLREAIGLGGFRVCFLPHILKSSRELTVIFFAECLVSRCQVGSPVSCHGDNSGGPSSTIPHRSLNLSLKFQWVPGRDSFSWWLLVWHYCFSSYRSAYFLYFACNGPRCVLSCTHGRCKCDIGFPWWGCRAKEWGGLDCWHHNFELGSGHLCMSPWGDPCRHFMQHVLLFLEPHFRRFPLHFSFPSFLVCTFLGISKEWQFGSPFLLFSRTHVTPLLSRCLIKVFSQMKLGSR